MTMQNIRMSHNRRRGYSGRTLYSIYTLTQNEGKKRKIFKYFGGKAVGNNFENIEYKTATKNILDFYQKSSMFFVAVLYSIF